MEVLGAALEAVDDNARTRRPPMRFPCLWRTYTSASAFSYFSRSNVVRGVHKKFNITKTIYDANGVGRQEKKLLNIDVKPGWKDVGHFIYDFTLFVSDCEG